MEGIAYMIVNVNLYRIGRLFGQRVEFGWPKVIPTIEVNKRQGDM